jgi:DNA invertase Pin-like site-specific DNA recombinase
MTRKRIAIFASVSTPQQAAVEKDSLPSQIRDGTAWADGIGDVVATYKVPGHSRKFIFYQDAEAAMEAYRQLRQDAEAKRFDILWCRSRDRLGRTAALISQVEAIVQAAGAEVYSAAMPHELGHSTETSAIFMSAIEGASAQAENVERIRRHRSGMRARIGRGLPSMWPVGYRPIMVQKKPPRMFHPGGGMAGYEI